MNEKNNAFFTLKRNNKTRYRSLFKHGLQAIARCAWMNMRRLFWFDNKLSLQIAQ